MVLHNQYPWDRSRTELRRGAEIGDDDFVVAFHPRGREVRAFIDRVRGTRGAVGGARGNAGRRGRGGRARHPVPPGPGAGGLRGPPVLEALAVVRGEHVCDNADVIRNASFSWSPMSAHEIAAKTGIEERRYTSLEPQELALVACPGRPGEVGAGRRPRSAPCW